MATLTAPDVVPVLSRERGFSQAKLTRKGSSPNPIVLFAIAVVVLLVVAGMWRASQNNSGVEKTITIVAAGKDLPAGTRIGFTSVHFMQIPKRYYSPSMALSPVNFIGRMTKTYIPMGEPIQDTMLFKDAGGLAATLENDERAITLQLSDDSQVGHYITQGDRVDVLVVSSKGDKKYTKTICQNIDVLMCVPKDQTLSKGGRSEQNSVTLALGSHQAEVVSEAAEVGKIRLVLRNHLGRIQKHLFGADPADLLPSSAFTETHAVTTPATTPVLPTPDLIPPPPLPAVSNTNIMGALPQPVQQPLQWFVEVISGSKKETYAFPQK